jgi:hypothetical protein
MVIRGKYRTANPFYHELADAASMPLFTSHSMKAVWLLTQAARGGADSPRALICAVVDDWDLSAREVALTEQRWYNPATSQTRENSAVLYHAMCVMGWVQDEHPHQWSAVAQRLVLQQGRASIVGAPSLLYRGPSRQMHSWARGRANRQPTTRKHNRGLLVPLW